MTLSSNPVLAIRKTDSGTRVASVDFMGLYVEYSPAVAAGKALPFDTRRIQRNSLLRR